ncbi:hypothetical protein BDW42DRAFT_34435 [Aspergillus taichungensis]|uniref:Uncharacterized protein n=1 Tax=Aspergillus taichungensis TaxID=482145 RepID=A0A2J5HF98_9EURO|nr:hypothetical protein BDW42DRAFT_34435 [Aspergillus taichungensis]
MDPSPEVLVHISAPSGVADDARYRAQVEAILNFRCVSRQAIVTSAGPDEDTQDNDNQTTEEAAAHPGVQFTECNAEFLDSSLVSVIPDSQPSQGPPLKRPRIHPPSPSPPPPPPLPSRGDPGSPGNPEETGNPSQPSAASPRTQPPPPSPSTQETTTTTTTSIALPLQIHPPNPPPSTAPFTTHITPTLAMLTTRLKSPRTYTPIQQTRALTNLERGHWTVPIDLITTTTPPLSPSPNPETKPQDFPPNTWPLPLFTRFWTFLSDFISEGRAGWGVWCSLEGDTTNKINEDHTWQPHQPPKEEGKESKLIPHIQPTILKVYAWGEVAEHIYLLLFLASERRIRRMGARWRDSRDEVVIVM